MFKLILFTAVSEIAKPLMLLLHVIVIVQVFGKVFLKNSLKSLRQPDIKDHVLGFVGLLLQVPLLLVFHLVFATVLQLHLHQLQELYLAPTVELNSLGVQIAIRQLLPIRLNGHHPLSGHQEEFVFVGQLDLVVGFISHQLDQQSQN